MSGPVVVVDGRTAAWIVGALTGAGVRLDRPHQRFPPDIAAGITALRTVALAAGDGQARRPSPATGPRWLTTGEAAARFGRSPRTVRRLAVQGLLRAHRSGGRWLIDPDQEDPRWMS